MSSEVRHKLKICTVFCSLYIRIQRKESSFLTFVPTHRVLKWCFLGSYLSWENFHVLWSCWLTFYNILYDSAVSLLNFIISMAFIPGHWRFWSFECLQLCFLQLFLAQNSKLVSSCFSKIQNRQLELHICCYRKCSSEFFKNWYFFKNTVFKRDV